MLLKIKNSSGMSILMAIGTIGILLIIVSSLAITYMRESQLSRFSYNEVLVSTAAEWAFEYGMLKVRNHTDGFDDGISSSVEPDGSLLWLTTPRSTWLNTRYEIIASSTGKTFSLSGSEHLIIPLFVSNETLLPGWIQSKNPTYHTGSNNTSNLYISWIPWLSWSIIGMSGSQNVAITGNGNISPSTNGTIRIKTSQCYSWSAWSTIDCSIMNPMNNDEEILYTYDETKTITEFLSTKKNPYFILYNSAPATTIPIQVVFSSNNPFSLPTITLTAIAKKWDTSQIFQFIEDKWKYYDALKYGIYNNN